MISLGIIENVEGDCSPEKFAEVETNGFRDRFIKFLQNES